MSNLTVFTNDDGVELVINCKNHAAFATQSGYSRMSGVAKNTISMRIKGVQLEAIKKPETLKEKGLEGVQLYDIKTAKVMTAGGLQDVTLIPANLVFKWLFTDNPALAMKMGEAGATIYMHRLANYEIPIKPKTSKMSLSQIDWIADRMVAEGALLPEDKLDFKLDKAIEHFPEMASGIADARKLVADKNKANADYAIACQQKQKQLLFSDFTKQLNRLCKKKGKKALLTSDLSGLSLMQRKDFLEKYGANGAKRLNKPEIIVIWQEMHDLGLGNFDKDAGTFETAI